MPWAMAAAEAGAHRPAHGTEVRAGRTCRDDGRCLHGPRRRRSSTSTRAASSRCRSARSRPRQASKACRSSRRGGTLFPGLIDLHNHLSYNALPLWAPVPKRFKNRGQWPTQPDYRKLISGPMTVIGEYRDADGQPSLLPALVRYVECKCLLGGVTTSQGIKLASNAGVQRFYRGLIRNVEQTDDADLPEAQGRIPDIEAKDASAFLARLEKEDSCLLLHLSEGVTRPSRSIRPRAVTSSPWRSRRTMWAINDTFTGIHSAGLLPEDFDVLAAAQAAR